MKVEILLFGRLTELVGQHRLQLADVPDTDTVSRHLVEHYPELKQFDYQIAVDQVIIHGNKFLTDGMTVALMPPFSGG